MSQLEEFVRKENLSLTSEEISDFINSRCRNNNKLYFDLNYNLSLTKEEFKEALKSYLNYY